MELDINLVITSYFCNFAVMELLMFEKMQSLPLIQGVGLGEFSEIIQSIKLDFEQYEAGDTIAHQDESCTRLIYIMDGTFDIEFRCDQPNMVLTESCGTNAYLIEPYNLFSVKRTFERTYTFRTKGSTFCIDKSTFLNRMLKNHIVRSNLINMTCNELRKFHDANLKATPLGVDGKICKLIRDMCKVPYGQKTVKVKMEDLAESIQETRLNVSKVLNIWSDNGLIELKRNAWNIVDLQMLEAFKNE